MMTSLKDRLQSYGAYHRDLRNKLTKLLHRHHWFSSNTVELAITPLVEGTSGSLSPRGRPTALSEGSS